MKSALPRPECEQFEGRLREICEGTAAMPISKINAYRARWGLPELVNFGRDSTASRRGIGSTSVMITHDKPCAHCGSNQNRPMIVRREQQPSPETGPGFQLVKYYESLGLSSCQACHDLAARMDEWGIDGCREKIDDIVADILPRARSWVKAQAPWIHAMLPGIVEDAALMFKIKRDVLAAIETAETKRLAASKRCGSCGSRSTGSPARTRPGESPIDPVSLTSSTRHLTFHLWPVKGSEAWQWNCDRLLANANLFNGRRLVAIATSPEAEDAERVRDYLKDFTDEFIIVKNDANLREVVSWMPMLHRLREYQSDGDVTFSCHGKCVRHQVAIDDPGSTVFRWADAMYETCLDWDGVRALLETHGVVGSFRRFGPQRRGGWGAWHFSGAFYWWRNRAAFARRWDHVPQQFFGTEAWPGLLFRPEESASIIGEKIEDLYNLDYWRKVIEPELQCWRATRKTSSQDLRHTDINR